MLVSGAVLLAVLRPPRPTRPILPLILLSIFGYAGSQFFYLAAIQFSNAATATLLQFLFLPMVAGYEAVTKSLSWSHRWTVTLLLAATGTLLLVVGSTFKILVTPIGLATGLTAAVAAAYYTLGSRHYVRTLGSWWITCWGFTIGGLVTLPFGLVSLSDYSWPSSASNLAEVSFLVGFVIVFGTILAFGLYVSGLQHLSATETGIASSAEPIMSTIAAYLFLGVVLIPTQYVGGALMISAVLLVATRRNQVKQSVLGSTRDM